MAQPVEEAKPSLKRLGPVILIPLLAVLFVGVIFGKWGVDLVVYVVVLLIVTMAPVMMYMLRTRLQRRGNELVYVNWLGRETAIPASDVDTATIENHGGRDNHLHLRRRSGAPELTIRGMSLWDKDEITRVLTGSGITLSRR